MTCVHLGDMLQPEVPESALPQPTSTSRDVIRCLPISNVASTDHDESPIRDAPECFHWSQKNWLLGEYTPKASKIGPKYWFLEQLSPSTKPFWIWKYPGKLNSPHGKQGLMGKAAKCNWLDVHAVDKSALLEHWNSAYKLQTFSFSSTYPVL